MKIEAGKTYVTKDGTKVGPMKEFDFGGNELFISEGDELAPLADDGTSMEKPQKWEKDGSVFAACRAEAGHEIVAEYKGPFKLKVVEGRYYETAEGKLEGPMEREQAFEQTVSEDVFRSGVVNTTQGNRGMERQYWKADGSVYLCSVSESEHHFVAERAAPDFRLEDGKTYIMANGDKVGPMEETESNDFVCDGFFCDPANFSEHVGPAPKQVWEEDGRIYYPMAGEELLHIVREAPLKQELVIKVDTDDIQDLIEEVRAEIEAAAGEALKKVEEAQAETNAVKDALNISCEEVRALKLRIQSLDALLSKKNEALNIYRAELGRINAETSSLKESNGVLRQSVWSRDDIIAHLESSVVGLQGQLKRERFRKERGDVRLRQARRRFATMARKADEAELELEKQTVEASKRVKFDVGNFILGLVMLASIAAIGAGFGAWLF